MGKHHKSQNANDRGKIYKLNFIITMAVWENFQTKLYGAGGREEHGSPIWTEKAKTIVHKLLKHLEFVGKGTR